MISSQQAIDPGDPILDFPVTSERLTLYRQTAERNWRNSQDQRNERREKAWRLVRLATTLLKEKFKADRVMVFGSLLDKDRFNLGSDVDITAWGISPQDTFKAMNEVRELDEDLEINLVDANACQQELLEKILREGKEVG